MAAIWKFSDGTILEQGGRVTGDGALAYSLRYGIAAIRDGLSMPVTMWPMPGGEVELDLEDIAITDTWARNVARLKGASVVEAPEFDFPPDPRGELEEPEEGEIN